MKLEMLCAWMLVLSSRRQNLVSRMGGPDLVVDVIELRIGGVSGFVWCDFI